MFKIAFQNLQAVGERCHVIPTVQLPIAKVLLFPGMCKFWRKNLRNLRIMRQLAYQISYYGLLPGFSLLTERGEKRDYSKKNDEEQCIRCRFGTNGKAVSEFNSDAIDERAASGRRL